MDIFNFSYIIITPVKNEFKYFKHTIDSVINQETLPQKWIIVDDESTDGTSELIASYALDYSFIEHHRLVNYQKYLTTTGGRSGTLMNYARKHIAENVDYIVKIDADISFSNTFFGDIFSEFLTRPNLGIASGHLVQDGIPELIKDYNSNRGAVRVYNPKCFVQIGFYYQSRGEDQMDTYTAQYLGWETRTFDFYFHHLKPEGARSTGLLNSYETGFYKGSIPYYWLYFLATILKSFFKSPIFIGSLIQLIGYLNSRFFKKHRPFNYDVCLYLINRQKSTILSLVKNLNNQIR
jgi:glycosyltransferase involved in cell wall biosynthesis